MNNLSIIGNVGKPPETRTTQGGKQESTFSVALNRFGKDKDGNNKAPIWVRCRAYGKQQEIVAKYVAKGSKVGLTGKLDVSEWRSHDGEAKYQIELVVNEITLLSERQAAEPASAQQQDLDAIFGSDEEVPF